MKQFLKNSPAIWALIAIVIVLFLLGFAILSKDWTRCGILLVLVLWILLCVKKDYTIWKLTKGGKK